MWYGASRGLLCQKGDQRCGSISFSMGALFGVEGKPRKTQEPSWKVSWAGEASLAGQDGHP